MDTLGTGEADDGRVRVTAVAGRIDAVRLDPWVMRQDGATLGRHVREAANAALDAAPAGTSAGADPAAIVDRLTEVRDQAARGMERVTRSMDEAMARIAEQTGIQGDPGPYGLEQLLDETIRDVAELFAPGPPAEPPAVDGVSVDVHGGRLGRVDIDPSAMRLPSVDLAERIAAAANGALSTGSPPSAVDPGTFARRVRRMQDQSLEHMRVYSASLAAIMASPHGPDDDGGVHDGR
ncbi:hypothetical protein GCM10022251_25500 [Phytohabitans flavus]|uniref:YbaB/EbfC DNA-binding family protein n=1 Tax=Phytohabitans flavus TaxID=1076124 RepID=A0A6F8XR06_9ACTN|nr:hypothetical protein Pflav_026560 [Phytohabitans flavus]